MAQDPPRGARDPSCDAGSSGSSGSTARGTRWLRGAGPVVALTLLGALLRIVGLGEQASWQDEVGTVDVLDHRFVDLLGAVRDTQNTPPFYYLLTS